MLLWWAVEILKLKSILLNDNATKYQKIDMLNLITELKGSRITILANKNADKAFIDQITYFANNWKQSNSYSKWGNCKWFQSYNRGGVIWKNLMRIIT